MKERLIDRVKQKVKSSNRQVFLRRDFTGMGSNSQIGRVLSKLHDEYVILHVGTGIYSKPAILQDPLKVVKEVTRLLPSKKPNRKLKLGTTRVHIGKSVTIEKAQERLDRLKLEMAQEVLKRNSLDIIRQESIKAINEWTKSRNGYLSLAYEEWLEILRTSSDDYLKYILTSRDEEPCNRLRQSPPYIKLLPSELKEKLLAA